MKLELHYQPNLQRLAELLLSTISEVNFQSPVRPGQIIRLYGLIKKVGRTSLTIEVEARRHSIHNGTHKPVCRCQMVFVRIDGDGEAVPIAPHIHYKFKNDGKEKGRGRRS